MSVGTLFKEKTSSEIQTIIVKIVMISLGINLFADKERGSGALKTLFTHYDVATMSD
jgi:hypothetical protein